jgi:ferredoxin
MRVFVDTVRCESHGQCEALAPAVFELGDDDKLMILQDQPDESEWPSVQAAVGACPMQAISLDES